MDKLRQVLIKGEIFYFSISFDIDDFIGDGIWWLQIYDNKHNLIYDKPFTSSMNIINKREVRRIIKKQFLTLRGELL